MVASVVGHLDLVAEAFDPAADHAGLAHRQLLLEVVALGVEKHELDIARFVVAAHTVGLPRVVRLVMRIHVDREGGDRPFGSLGNPGGEAPVDEPARAMPEQIGDLGHGAGIGFSAQ
jgi:hypothetical protein